MTLNKLWSILRGRRTNFRWLNISWTYYPDGDPMGKPPALSASAEQDTLPPDPVERGQALTARQRGNEA